MEATTTLPKAKTRCGPEFAAQAYLACTKGVATQRQQKAVAARAAHLSADKAELLAACKKAEEWLAGWASAEPYISELRAAIVKAGGAS